MHSLRKKSSSRGLVVMSSTRRQTQQQQFRSEENALEKNTSSVLQENTPQSCFSHSTQQGQYQTYVLSYR